MRFSQSDQACRVHMQVTGWLTALDQMCVNGFAHGASLRFMRLALQMFAAFPQKLYRVKSCPECEALQVKACRARGFYIGFQIGVHRRRAV